MSDKKPKKYRTGCLLPLGIYVLAVVLAFFLTRPAPVMGDFDEDTVRRFSIAVAERTDNGFEYRRISLASLRARPDDFRSVDFRLPEPSVTIHQGDIHKAAIIDDHGDRQQIEFYYSNTYTSTSTYRAFVGRIEPISYKVTSTFADVMLPLIMILPAYALAALITLIRNHRARRATANRQSSASTGR